MNNILKRRKTLRQASKSQCNERLLHIGSVRIEHFRKGKLLSIREGFNLITDIGLAELAKLRIGTGTDPTKIAIGTGTTAPAAGDDAMEAQVDIQTAVTDLTTIAVTDDTSQYIYTFVLSADNAIAEAGLLSVTPKLYCRQTFTPIPGKSGDDIKVTWKLQS